jgi:ADP-ribose pyrophosphatase YjhB (NUDIX family)
MQNYLELREGPQVCTSFFLRNTAGKFKEVSLWTTPGGRCDEGESVGENLFRELLEETGIAEAMLEGFVGMTPGAKQGDMLYVFAGTTSAQPRLMEPEKFSEWRWFGVDAVPQNFINPRALRLYKMYLDRPRD